MGRMNLQWGWLGLGLIAIAWPLNWVLAGDRTLALFFPLWLGYVLTVDGIVLARTGSSLMKRLGYRFALLFLLSAPAWWLFELINMRTRNWEYLGGEWLSQWEHFLVSSLCFSTVIPAVFETAELIGTLPGTDRFSRGPQLQSAWANRFTCLTAGCIMVVLTLLWPRFFYPLVWCGVVFVLEPLNAGLGRPTLFRKFLSGNWRPMVCLSIGALICGFFWEMWNFFSFPKWVYHVPGVGFLHVFEMPILGYLGYIPFAWELYALSYFLWPNAPRLRI